MMTRDALRGIARCRLTRRAMCGGTAAPADGVWLGNEEWRTRGSGGDTGAWLHAEDEEDSPKRRYPGRSRSGLGCHGHGGERRERGLRHGSSLIEITPLVSTRVGMKTAAAERATGAGLLGRPRSQPRAERRTGGAHVAATPSSCSPDTAPASVPPERCWLKACPRWSRCVQMWVQDGVVVTSASRGCEAFGQTAEVEEIAILQGDERRD